jgi:lipid-A-disaccharide synthase
MELVLPTPPHLLPLVREAVARWAVAPRLVIDPAEKQAAFRRARAALAASGTVSLELALAGVPTVAAYRMSALEAFIITRLYRLLARLPSVILANLVIGENVVPQFLQADCTPQRLADALVPLLADTPQRQRQVEAFARLDRIMAIGSAAPSAKAAAIVLEVVQRGRPSP